MHGVLLSALILLHVFLVQVYCAPTVTLTSCVGVVNVTGVYAVSRNLVTTDYLAKTGEACIVVEAPDVILDCKGLGFVNISSAVIARKAPGFTIQNCVFSASTLVINSSDKAQANQLQFRGDYASFTPLKIADSRSVSVSNSKFYGITQSGFDQSLQLAYAPTSPAALVYVNNAPSFSASYNTFDSCSPAYSGIAVALSPNVVIQNNSFTNTVINAAVSFVYFESTENVSALSNLVQNVVMENIGFYTYLYGPVAACFEIYNATVSILFNKCTNFTFGPGLTGTIGGMAGSGMGIFADFGVFGEVAYNLISEMRGNKGGNATNGTAGAGSNPQGMFFPGSSLQNGKSVHIHHNTIRNLYAGAGGNSPKGKANAEGRYALGFSVYVLATIENNVIDGLYGGDVGTGGSFGSGGGATGIDINAPLSKENVTNLVTAVNNVISNIRGGSPSGHSQGVGVYIYPELVYNNTFYNITGPLAYAYDVLMNITTTCNSSISGIGFCYPPSPCCTASCEALTRISPCNQASKVIGSCDADDFCDAGYCVPSVAPEKTQCRPADGECDSPEYCDGISSSCPPDTYLNSTLKPCRPANDSCDVAEFCTGQNKTCPPDTYYPAQHTCRNATGPCDIPEKCTGFSTACPPDILEPPDHICQRHLSICLPEGRCDGKTGNCSTVLSNGVACRAASSLCDVPDFCNGTECSTHTAVSCQNTCGDAICDLKTENCVSCPVDCQAPCDMCGDSQCDTPEDCNSCPADCGVCEKPKCVSCSVNGRCSAQGICVCNDGYSGDDCGKEIIQKVNTTINATAPIFNIQPPPTSSFATPSPSPSSTSSSGSTPSPTTPPSSPPPSFNIQVIGLQEYDASFSPLNFVNLSSLPPLTGFELTLAQNDTFQLYTYTYILPNGASLQLMTYLFNDSTPIEFLGATSTYDKGTMKIACEIRNWPFTALTNSLSVLISSAVVNYSPETNNCDGIVTSNDTQNILSYSIVVSSVTLYGQINPNGEVDGRNRELKIKYTPSEKGSLDGILEMNAPHFWESLVLDPNYAALFSPPTTGSDCHNKDLPRSSQAKQTNQNNFWTPIMLCFFRRQQLVPIATTRICSEIRLRPKIK